MKLKLQIFALGAALLLAGAGTAAGGTLTNLINVQYRGSAGETYKNGPSYNMSGAAVLGSAGNTWNSEQVHYYTGPSSGNIISGASLVNSANAASGLTLTLGYSGPIVQGARYTAGTLDANSTTNLMQSCVSMYTYTSSGASASTTTHTIGGLSGYNGATANLIVYAGAPSAVSQNIAITGGATGGNSGTTLTTSSSSRQISAGKGVAYNSFTNLTLNGGSLVFTVNEPSAASSSDAGFCNGFQLQIFTPDPSITTPPASQRVLPGQTATFSVAALGSPTLAYQWQANGGTGFTNLVDGGQVSGATTSTLTISNVTANWTLAYQVIVANSSGSVTSSPANLATGILINGDIGPGALQSGAAILGQSGDAWNALTGPGIFSTVVNSGNNTVSGVTVTVDPGSTGYNTASPTVDAATAALMSDFVYRAPGGAAVPVTISGLGAYVNQSFTLVVYAGMDPGQPCTENITAGATGGNTASTLNTTSATRKLSDGIGVAYNTFTNGTLTAGTLTFTVNGASYHGPNGFQLQIQIPDPLITANPVSQTNVNNATATFSVTATGSAQISYQWQEGPAGGPYTNLTDGGQISGSQSNVLTISNLSTNWAGGYQVIVSNSGGAVTSAPAAILTVQTTPAITAQPASQTIIAGGTVLLNVGATGGMPLSYQWQAGPAGGPYTNLVNGGQISGASSNLLTISAVTANWALAYRLVLGNSFGSVTSVVASVTVLPLGEQPNVPAPGAMGPALAANVSGSYSSPPANFPTSPSDSVTTAPVTGNGDMGIIVGGASSALQFYVGKADFFGVLHGIIMPVGSLTLSASALSGSSYALNQNVGPATITGAFANGASALAVTSWVATAENTAVIQLNNTGTSPLSLTSQLLDGFAGSKGNPATYGSTNNSTWLNVSPDTVYLELGNQLHNAAGTAPFTGKIADLRLYSQALSSAMLANLDGAGVPTPLLQWATTNMGTAALIGNASLNSSDPHGGSVSLPGGSSDELAVGDLPLPENQFTFSTWINVATTTVSGNIVTAQIPYADTYGSTFPYPYTRGLTLNLVSGNLSASLNQSGYLNLGSAYQTFYADSPNNFTTTAAGVLPANQWIQAEVTYDGNTLTIYTNGVALGTPVTFPTGLTNGMMGWNKMATHLGDTNVIYNGCAPQGVLMQSVLGATATTSSQGALTFTIPAGGQVTIALAAVTDRNKTNYFAAAQQQSQQATTGSLSNLFLAHNAWWSNFWAKSFVQIPNQLIQNNWYGSLYLLACCSTSNSPAPGLWGNFITGTQPQWGGDYTLDYNYEAPFWGALACNHSELADNYDKPLLDQISRGRATAQYVFGSNTGIYFYCHLIPAPGWADDPGSFWGQKSDAIFAAVNCAMRWKYTQDTNYAAKVYPYLKGVADFWNSYLTLSGNQYVDINDSCWEQSGADNNPSTSLAFIQLVYPALVQMSQVLNLDAGSRAQWNDIIARLTPQTIVPASSISSLAALGSPYDAPGVNVIRASSSGTAFPTPAVTLYQDHALRNSSAGMGPCQVIYPGWNIGLESDPATLLAASNTIWLAAQWYDNNNMCNFYPGAACVGYDPNAILSILNTMLTYYQNPNFMEDPGGGGTENYAIVPATLAAMFVQSYQTNIHIFPNWPTNQSAAFGNLNACGGFLVSGAMILGQPGYVLIQSTAGQMLKLANPWPGATVQCVSSLTGVNTLSGSVLYYQTQVGEVLTLTSTSAPNLPAPANVTAVLNGSTVALNWNAVPGAAGYNVKRATASGGPYFNLVSGTSVTNYSDASVGNQTTYYYAVSALAPGFESTNSAVAVVTPPLIINGSFEAQTVGANGYAIVNPTSWSVTGQSGGAVVAIIHPGTSDGRFGAGHVPAGMDGVNYCQLFMNGTSGSATVYQDLGPANQYQAGTTYTLTAAFGLEKGNFPAGALVFYNSSLVALASNVITSAMLTSNAFTSFSVTYTGTGGEGGNGDIVVSFTTTGAPAGTSFDIDNVRLSVVSPPTVSSNAYLTSLTLNPALSFNPGFASNVLNYAATEAYGSSPTVMVANGSSAATNQLSYRGTTNLLASGVASSGLGLDPNPGVTNLVQVQVTAQDGVTMKTYTVNVTQLPNQATQPSLTNSVSNGSLNLNWGLDRLGYRLLVQTNNLNLGVSSNPNDWAMVPGSTATNAATITIPTTNLNEYYRLAYP